MPKAIICAYTGDATSSNVWKAQDFMYNSLARPTLVLSGTARPASMRTQSCMLWSADSSDRHPCRSRAACGLTATSLPVMAFVLR